MDKDMIDNIFSAAMNGRGDPDFVNEEGVKWWCDKSGTSYARKPDIKNRKLPNVSVWYVELPNGEKEYVIIDKDEPIYSSQNYEDIAIHIDIMKLKLEKE